jgi:Ser/Thr protein kinase RdoA (MazF antagonist)
LPELRRQVIHADLHPENVLATQTGEIAGVIDFGDMLQAPLIMEVAVAASYLRPSAASVAAEDIALSWIGSLVAAYHSVLPLRDEELELLFDLLRARIAASITILRWRAAERGAQDVYSQNNLQAERSGAGFLGYLTGLGRQRFQREIRKAIKNK